MTHERTWQHVTPHVTPQRLTSWEATHRDPEAGPFDELSIEPGPGPYGISEYLTHGDYVGAGSVGEANVRAWSEEYADHEGEVWTTIGGSYGYQTIVFLTEKLTPEMIETLDALDDYCIISDDVHSEVTQERENTALERCKRDLAKAVALDLGLPEDIIDPDWAAHRLHYAACEHDNGSWFRDDHTWLDTKQVCADVPSEFWLDGVTVRIYQKAPCQQMCLSIFGAEKFAAAVLEHVRAALPGAEVGPDLERNELPQVTAEHCEPFDMGELVEWLAECADEVWRDDTWCQAPE